MSDHPTSPYAFSGLFPVAIVSGYFGGRCVVEPTNPAMILNKGMALYNMPPQHEYKYDPMTGEPLIDGWPLYSGLPPREWQGLTVEDVDALVKAFDDWPVNMVGHLLVFAAEDKLKEKNHGGV